MHRHSSAKCVKHSFCKGAKIEEVYDKYKGQASIIQREFEETRNLIMQDDETGGVLNMQGYKQYYGPDGANLFFKDKPVSKERKVVVSDEDADIWLAAHFNMTVANAPQILP